MPGPKKFCSARPSIAGGNHGIAPTLTRSHKLRSRPLPQAGEVKTSPLAPRERGEGDLGASAPRWGEGRPQIAFASQVKFIWAAVFATVARQAAVLLSGIQAAIRAT